MCFHCHPFHFHRFLIAAEPHLAILNSALQLHVALGELREGFAGLRGEVIHAQVMAIGEFGKSINFSASSGEVTKGLWWMPWRQVPTKDVGNCDKPRGAVNRRYIRGFPNGETH